MDESAALNPTERTANMAAVASANATTTTLLDVLPQIWPFLESYERRSIRQCSLEGLRCHDSLITVVSVHDLWGRVLPPSVQEIGASILRMMARGCRPTTLILRLQCGTPRARQARGLAVLSALDRRSASRCLSGSEPSEKDIDGSLVSVRLEGVPLTGRFLRALAKIAPGLTSLKLYGYDLSQRPSVEQPPRPAQRPFPAFQHLMQQPYRLRQPGTDLDPQLPATTPHTGAAPLGALNAAGGAAFYHPSSASASRGVPAVLALLAPSLREITLQDCHFGRKGSSDMDGRGGDPDPTGAYGGSGGGGMIYAATESSGNGDASCLSLSSSEYDRAVGHDVALPAHLRDGGCRSCSCAAVVAPLMRALYGCSQLRHLGIRHHDCCPVLTALLTAPPHLGNAQKQVGAAACCCGGGEHAVNGSADVAGGGGGLQCRGQLLPLLATLTALTSLKLQTKLPENCQVALSSMAVSPGGPLPVLAGALAQLTGLTRLEFGSRTAVQSIPAVLTPSAVRRLRDLDISMAQVSAPYDLSFLAQLTALTRLAVAAIVPANLEHVPQPPQPPLPLPASRTGPAGGWADACVGRCTEAPLPLALELVELSVAAPLAPALLLALRRPASLRVIRTTGFTLGPDDVDTAAADAGGVPYAHAPQAAAAASTGPGPVTAAGYCPPAVMSVAACDHLASAVRLLHGRFAYRDLGIELHIGFHDSEALARSVPRRRYLAAPPGRPAGHWAWATQLVPLGLQGLELAGLELREEDVAMISRQLGSLEDLRLDCRYPLSSLPHLASLRRLRRLLLNASFWQPQPQQGPQSQSQQQHKQEQSGSHQTPSSLLQPLDARRESAEPLIRLCRDAPECLYDVALASHGRAAGRLAAMWAVVRVEQDLPRVGCGALRVWVCP